MSTTKKVGKQEVKYAQYMNVATGQGMMAVNSSNMWFPVADGVLTIKLFHPGDAKKSIAAKMAPKKNDILNDFGEVFHIGYRMYF